MNDKLKILIVDDEPIGRQLLEAILMPEDYDMIFAEDGGIAWKKTQEFLPDIILLDVMMPVMDGYEVCKKIRMNHQTAHITIFLITALDDRDSRIKGIDAGADDYISKPYDRIEILAKVKNKFSLLKYRQRENTIGIKELSISDVSKSENIMLGSLINEMLSHPFSTATKHIDIYSTEKIDKSRCAFIELTVNDGSYFIGISNSIPGPDSTLANCFVTSIIYKNIYRTDLTPSMLLKSILEEIHNPANEKKMPQLIDADFSFFIVYFNSTQNHIKITGLNLTIFISAESANQSMSNQNKTFHPYYLMGNQDLQFSTIKEMVFFSNNLLEIYSQPEILMFLNTNLVSGKLKTLSSIIPQKFNQINDILIVKLGILND